MEVYNELESGLAEPVYHEAYEKELRSSRVPHVHEAVLRIYYKGECLKSTFYADFICFEKIVVELKALPRITEREEAQLLNYLKISRLRLGLLINFGKHTGLEWKRMVL